MTVMEQLQVTFEITRITFQIFADPELGGIHKDGHDGDVGFGLGELNEREVPVMQVAHGRDKPDKLSLGPQTDGDGLHLVY